MWETAGQPPSAESQARLPLGARLGPYEILKFLGAGGMGEVYAARDTRLKRTVALKVLRTGLADRPDVRRRFEREAHAISALNHAHICSLYDIGEQDGVAYLVMEYVEGVTLAERLRKGPLPFEQVLAYGSQIADALVAAHSRGIVHRDLKPANIMVTPAGIKILDFGVARFDHAHEPASESSVTRSSTVSVEKAILGTLPYMAPEQLRGKADARTDIFSFGLVLYEMATGRRAFDEADQAGQIAAIVGRDPVPVSALNPDVPAVLERVIQSCLVKDPAGRWQSALDLARELKWIAVDVVPAALPLAERLKLAHLRQPVPPTTLVRKPTRRRNVLLATALLIVGAVAAVLTGNWINRWATAPFDSLAVLPFQNDTGDSSLDHLSEGITESLINTFGQISALKVMARSATAGARNSDPSTVGKKLSVNAVLAGRMYRKGQSWVVSAELIDIRSNRHLWGAQYDGSLSEMSSLPGTMSRDVVDRLHLSLTASEKQRLAKRQTQSTQAYQLYSLGHFYWNKRTQEGIARAIDNYQQAIQKDPKFALAWAQLANCYTLQAGPKPPSEMYPKALEAVTRALEIDDMLGEAHAVLGFIKLHYEWDWPGTEQEYKRAIALNPSYATAYSMYARYLGAMGRFDEAIAATRHAQELDPTSVSIRVAVGFQLYLARRYDEAIQQYMRTLEMDRNFASAHVNLGQSLVQKGRYPEAIAELKAGLTGTDAGTTIELLRAHVLAGQRDEGLRLFKQVRELSAKRYVSSYYLAVADLSLGNRDQALDLLEKGYQERSWQMIFLNVDPRFDRLRSVPRFQDLLKRLHFTNPLPSRSKAS